MTYRVPDDMWNLIKDNSKPTRARSGSFICRQGHDKNGKSDCVICKRENRAKFISRDPDYRRADMLKTRYGISVMDFEELWNKQMGLCAICLCTLLRGNFTHVDHDHKTKKIRGLLCRKCNWAIGAFHDMELLNRAIAYLGI